ncbi:MAG: cobaltochelatase subunit CobN, partial [Muribaculaceae bacterium]|nr:cobaltochelatase subunit CobN [Muribaculaceae bacterium]
AIAVETRATILNPDFIKERMKGDATTAQMFGEIFRNIFGWSATRPEALNDKIYDDLYDIYVEDIHGLGVKDYFERVNPAALQEMTATMMESARKGFWNPTDKQLSAIAGLHADVTAEHGAPCTEFVCGNKKLQKYISSRLDSKTAERYEKEIAEALAETSGAKRLKAESKGFMSDKINESAADYIAVVIVAVLLIIVFLAITVRRKERK